MSTAMWKLEKDLCRCCHAEGSFKHLSDPCFQLGQEEIYSDMLQDCLDIKIVPMTGILSDVTYTICESCVVRLRDAANFKQQVQDCEERFKEMYSKNLIRGLAVKDEPMNESDDLKQEFQSIDEDDDDAFMNFDDDGDDSLDDQPLSVEVKPKIKGKAKAKPKPKAKKTPAKKTTKGKPIKLETEDITEAAVSGEKKKGKETELKAEYDETDQESEHEADYEETERRAVCEVTLDENGEEVFTCLDCERTYNAKACFTQHYRHIHLKLRHKTFPCPICRIPLFPHKKAAHLETEHGRPAPTCNVCERKFTAPHMVLRHQREVHMGEKNYQCDQCNKSFWDKGHLRTHQLKHTDIKNYSCDLCGKRFKWRKNLSTHMDMHLDVRRYVCSVCGVAFVQATSLKYHVTRRHPEHL